LPRITIDVRALYAALKSKRAAADQSWRDVAAELGISPSTFTRMAQGGRPDIDTFENIIAAAYKSITRSKGDDARPGHTSLGRRV
jgi:transcriptional regulator with XRE-family HTH domain